MAREYDHERLTPAEFAAGLEQAGITPGQFQRLTGVRPNTVKAWLLPDDHPRASEPPFWVSSWLGLYLLPGGAERALTIAETKLIGDDDGTA